MSDPKYPVGAWLSFWHGDRMKIGRVLYIRKGNWGCPRPWVYFTDAGPVEEEHVLEARNA